MNFKLLLSICIASFIVASCNSKNGNKKDTAVIHVGSEVYSLDVTLFNYCKNNPYTNVYVFQVQDGLVGNKRWVDWMIIDDFSEEEFNEMTKFEDYKKFRDDVQNNNVKNRNYSFKPVGNLH